MSSPFHKGGLRGILIEGPTSSLRTSSAYWKSKSIRCNDSLKLLEDNFEKKPIPKPECEAKEIDENIKLAKDLGIVGTPTIIMPDGSIHIGFIEADQLIAMVDSHSKKK